MSGRPISDLAREAADAVRPRLGGINPRLALVLGSGLGALADAIANPVSIPFGEVAGFPSTTVAGHAGRLVAGRFADSEVLAIAGRFHLYEGHSAPIAALPVRVAHALGVRTLFVSNAAGGVRRSLRPGDLMLIEDHINLMWRNPLEGALEPGDQRFPDMSAPYDRELLGLLRASALESGLPVIEGVYAGLLGPSYETPAEVRMLERVGADAVGMSTVPEVIVARALGMRVAGVSCITNAAAGLSAQPLSHADVLRTSEVAARRFADLVGSWVKKLGQTPILL